MATDGHPALPGRAARRSIRTLAALLLSLATIGCVGQGLLYTRVVRPYAPDFHDTPTGSKECRVNEHVLREPISGAGISVSFTLRVLEQAARDAGITNLCHADIETLSILNGIYEKKALILYGD